MKGERKMKIKKICIIALIIVLISSLATSCFAVTEATEATNNSKITKEQLNEKFQELKDNDSEIEKIVTGDNVIEVIKNNDKYEIEYEIEEDKVTFSIEAEVKQGMSWEEYTKLFGDSTGDASDGNMIPLIEAFQTNPVFGYGDSDLPGVFVGDTSFFVILYSTGLIGFTLMILFFFPFVYHSLINLKWKNYAFLVVVAYFISYIGTNIYIMPISSFIIYTMYLSNKRFCNSVS